MNGTYYKYFFLLPLSSVMLMGCPSKPMNDSAFGKKTNSSVPGDSLQLNKLASKLHADFMTSFGVVAGSSGDNPSDANNGITVVPTSRLQLKNMRSVTKIMESKGNVGLEVPGFGGMKLGKNESSMSVYYIEAKTVVAHPGDTAIYGVGYSVHYLFKKVKRGIIVTNMPSIAASVQLESNKTQVLYALQTYGMIGTPLVRYFKPVVNRPFDVDGFAIIQSSIDGIQNVMGDDALANIVRYSPEILPIKARDLRRPI